jgi:hypothetical protein
VDLSPSQIAKLEKLIESSFRFVTIERFERYVAVERDGFAALLDVERGQLRLLGMPGFRLGGGIGMLVERGEERAFVWHDQKVKATKDLLAAYNKFRTDLDNLLSEE